MTDRPHETARPQRTLAIRLTIAGAILAIGAVTSAVSSSLIDVWAPDRTRPTDLLLDTLPYVGWTQYLTDIGVFLAIGILLVYALRGRIERLPAMMAIFGIMYILRALIMPLTPLQGAAGNHAYYGFIRLIQNGMFPSGHSAAAMLCIMLVRRCEAPRIYATALICGICVWGGLLLSSGHYSIDIVGGLLLAYFVQNWYRTGVLLKPLRAVLGMPGPESVGTC